jgi:N-acetylglucosaminyldiphosphoundecaprenol N-acetyl-beta-D-mannosaminyltransferase
MKVFFANQEFLVGKMVEVVAFLFRELHDKKSNSKVVLPCSLYDLAMIDRGQKQAFFYQNVDYFVNDSMWLTFWFRLKHGGKIDRLYGPDLMKSFLNKSSQQPNLKHFFLAADQRSMLDLQDFLHKNYPDLSAHFTFLPRNISLKQQQIFLKQVLTISSQVIWLGIGSPKQVELATWLKDNSKGRLIFCVGAAFDFLGGQKKQAPLWLQKTGLEWLFRLLSEPKRLWRRYLLEVPKWLGKMFWQKVIRQK